MGEISDGQDSWKQGSQSYVARFNFSGSDQQRRLNSQVNETECILKC